MVLKAMKCTPSVKNPLFYNINKIEQGEAELVAVRNIRSAEFGVLYRTLLEREALAIKTKKPSVHFMLSGDDGESLTDEEAVEIIDGCLKQIDMAGQPYIIVRHDDTKHVHYHVVSTKIMEDGRSILWNGIGKRLILELMKYQEKYSFKAGKDLQEAKKRETNYKKKGTKADILREFSTGLSATSFLSREAFIEEMKEKDVRMAVFTSKHTGREMLRCSRLDEKGKAITRPVYMDGDEVIFLDKAVERNNRLALEKQKAAEVVSESETGMQRKDAMADKRAFAEGFFPEAEIEFSGVSMTLEGRNVALFYVNNDRYAMTTVGGVAVISLDPIPFGPIPRLGDITWRNQAKELLAYTGQALVPLRNQIPQGGLFVPEKGYHDVKLPPGFRIDECDGYGFLVMPNGKSICIQDDGGLYIRLTKGKYDVITKRQHDNLEKLKRITGQMPMRKQTKTTKSGH